MTSIKLLLHKRSPGDGELGAILDDAIAFETWQSGGTVMHTHASILEDEKDLIIIEAFYPVLHRRDLTIEELPYIDVMEITGVDEETAAAAHLWLVGQLGKPYSVVDLLHFVGRIDDNSPADSHYFCSMLAAEFAARCGKPLFAPDRCQFFKITPAMIWISTVPNYIGQLTAP